MDHDTLSRLAGRWLRRQGCPLVLLEARARANIEHPDAIGWLRNGDSILVEAKANRKDFREDRRPDRKMFRREPHLGMGTSRYYICRSGLILPEDVEPHGWGLLYALPSFTHLVVPSQDHARDTAAELRLIARVARNTEAAPQQLRLPRM